MLKLSEKGGQKKKLCFQYDCAYRENITGTLT